VGEGGAGGHDERGQGGDHDGSDADATTDQHGPALRDSVAEATTGLVVARAVLVPGSCCDHGHAAGSLNWRDAAVASGIEAIEIHTCGTRLRRAVVNAISTSLSRHYAAVWCTMIAELAAYLP
jgi:hypothetical protein